MHKDETKAPFKITALLYLVVLLLGTSFYYINNAFVTIEKNTKGLYSLGKTEGLSLSLSQQYNDETLAELKYTFNILLPWLTQQKNPYIVHNLRTVESCIAQYRTNNSQKQEQCLRQVRLFTQKTSFAVEQSNLHLSNKIYLLLIATLLGILYLIYFIRMFIDYQLTKHSVYDKDTNLYNYNYFKENLNSMCARAQRYKYPLSVLSVDLLNLESASYSAKEKKYIYSAMGDMLLMLARTSDIPCRIDDNHIAIILPFTEEKNANILLQRIKETFEQYNFNVSNKPVFRYTITEYQPPELSKAYLERIKNKG